MYKFALKHIFTTNRHGDNIQIIHDHKRLHENIIFITVTFLFPNRLDEKKEQTIKLLKDNIQAAILLLFEEKRFTSTVYRMSNISLNNEIIKFQHDKETLIVHYASDKTIVLANKIERHIDKLYKVDSPNNIYIVIGNINIELPKLKMTSSRLAVSNSINSEVHSFRFISTIDLGRTSSFIVELPNSPQLYKLVHVNQHYRNIFQRAAKYNDTLTLEVLRITETIRCITCTKRAFKFVDMVNDSEPVKQLLLLGDAIDN